MKNPVFVLTKTDWSESREHVEDHLNINIFLKPENDISEAEHFNKSIQEVAWNATPTGTESQNHVLPKANS